MSSPPLWLRISPLTREQIPAVAALETAAYAGDPSVKNYHDELENRLAHYFVLQVTNEQSSRQSIGVGGLWLMGDEAHIMTLAIEPAWQGQGLGEWLLVGLIEQARLKDAAKVTLEVRPSNQAARALYRKYEFRRVGQRPGYYDNGEDAYILTTPSLESPYFQAVLAEEKAKLARRLAKINR